MTFYKAAFATVLFTLMTACGQTPTKDTGNESSAASEAIDLTEETWLLNPDASRIGFSSIKSGEIFENHSFATLSGSVSGQDGAMVTVALDSVDTKIEIRDERMKTILFETEQHPTAIIAADVSLQELQDLRIGMRKELEIEASLSLHGQVVPMYADVEITRIAMNQIEVASTDPVFLHVADFELAAGLEQLREIANLNEITPVVPVTFSLVFEVGEE